MPLLLLLFIAVPLIEIALFIQIGGIIGLGWTLAIVLTTAVIGTWMVRQQGREVLLRVQQSFSQLNDPTEPLAHGAMILLSGALLLTPGFFTDTVGFLLLVPRFRETVFRWLRSNVSIGGSSTYTGFAADNRHRPFGGDVIDGDYSEVDPEPRRTKGPSGWTQD
ncbi:FxsA family protein [Tropicimonas sp.]|uniref:FxsA family protein n=1 Tax=Tropicimonas sp. TaxID=2067044 RepID=UPI003A84991E